MGQLVEYALNVHKTSLKIVGTTENVQNASLHPYGKIHKQVNAIKDSFSTLYNKNALSATLLANLAIGT